MAANTTRMGFKFPDEHTIYEYLERNPPKEVGTTLNDAHKLHKAIASELAGQFVDQSFVRDRTFRQVNTHTTYSLPFENRNAIMEDRVRVLLQSAEHPKSGGGDYSCFGPD